MKKSLLFAVAALALAACVKETPVREGTAIDPSKIVFNIQVESADATKGVKTAWESGDDVYVFFEDNTSQYVKMTFDGTSWTHFDKDGGTTFSGLTLAASGKKLSAVYIPDFVLGTATPAYDTDKWTFGSVGGYFQSAENVGYSVTTTSDVTTLNATISLVAPARISQIYIPLSELSPLLTGEEYVLTATHIAPVIFNGIVPGGAVSYGTTTKGFPMPSHNTMGGDAGLYFWGILEGAGTYDFDFQLVKQDAEKKYAISSKSKSVTSKAVGSTVAVKLTNLTDNGNFVSLGYANCPLWATGNLDKTNNKIVSPLEAGEYFMYGFTTPYISIDAKYTEMDNPLPTANDAAYSVNTAWRIPTKEQFDALYNSSNTSTTWKTGWTNIGSDKGGRLITSRKNGISLFLAAVGRYDNGTLNNAGVYCMYWTSTPSNTNIAYSLISRSNFTEMDHSDRSFGSSVRPVKN